MGPRVCVVDTNVIVSGLIGAESIYYSLPRGACRTVGGRAIVCGNASREETP